MADDLKVQFEQARKDVETLTRRPATEDMLYLYGHYKQATEGDVKKNRPGAFDPVGRAKFDAWAKLKGHRRETAMQLYVAKVRSLVKTHK